MTFRTIEIERRGRAMVLRLNRPEALNALNAELIAEIDAALSDSEKDPEIGCVVLTGSEKAFAAGADIKEMRDKNFVEAFLEDFLGRWDAVARARKPIIAAVSGFALGGGCELAMMCDFILASETAQFGQPEIKLGVMPGAGGTQRLTRAVGKAKAMELCLTGRMMGAEEAERAGLVARILPAAELLPDAIKTAQRVAAMSTPAVLSVKDAINRAFETSLAEGVRFERRAFHALFSTHDQKEGMTAFVEKRSPSFQNR
ncbi:MAG: enoyl-CoA hydratase [Methylocystis sp.]